jgi:2'-deoxynucleoside 5'-phosphate N-hydrolase
MKFFLSIKFHEDGSNLNLINSIIKEAKDSGNEMVSIFTDYENNGEKNFEPSELMKITFNAINDCDAFVVDLSEKGVGLGIEAGYAFSKGIPIYIIAKNNSDISDTLKGISRGLFLYSSPSELKEFFSKISSF